jgi:hypothetical protein
MYETIMRTTTLRLPCYGPTSNFWDSLQGSGGAAIIVIWLFVVLMGLLRPGINHWGTTL